MSLTADEQDLMEVGLGTIPVLLRSAGRQREELIGMAKAAGATKRAADDLLKQAYIGTADSDTADWLALLAGDYGAHRQAGETDATFRLRITQVPLGVTRPEILDAVQAVISALGIPGTVEMVEFPRDAAYLGTYAQDAGTGGVFAAVDGVTNGFAFTPTVPFASPPFVDGVSGRVRATQITLAGCDSGGNDGTFAITGLLGNAATYVNAAGVAEADTGCAWATVRRDRYPATLDGHSRAYVNRGYRCWRGYTTPAERRAMGGILLILPYGTTEPQRLAIRAQLATIKAAGIAGLVERRINP